MSKLVLKNIKIIFFKLSKDTSRCHCNSIQTYQKCCRSHKVHIILVGDIRGRCKLPQDQLFLKKNINLIQIK